MCIRDRHRHVALRSGMFGTYLCGQGGALSRQCSRPCRDLSGGAASPDGIERRERSALLLRKQGGGGRRWVAGWFPVIPAGIGARLGRCGCRRQNREIIWNCLSSGLPPRSDRSLKKYSEVVRGENLPNMVDDLPRNRRFCLVTGPIV